MHLYYLFAHNGINHANGMEAAAHQSNALVWVALLTAIVAAGLYAAKRYLGNRQTEDVEEEE